MIASHAPHPSPSCISPINHKFHSEHLIQEATIVELIVMSCAANFDKQLNAIRTAIAAQDMSAINRAAHSLKSAACNLSAKALHSACTELEKAAHSNDSAAVNSCAYVVELAASNLRSVLPA